MLTNTRHQTQLAILDLRIMRLSRILRTRAVGSRKQALTDAFHAALVKRHDAERITASYDARRAEAEADMTGQDGDAFDYGE
jgi:hypothetical protein